MEKPLIFCTCPSHNVVKRNAGGKKGKLLCCKGIFDRIKANLAEIQLKAPKCTKNAFFCKKFQELMPKGQHFQRALPCTG